MAIYARSLGPLQRTRALWDDAIVEICELES
jgi:hypothetical protein